MEQPTRCNSNNLMISKISLTCFGQSFVHLQERKTEVFTAYGIVSCCCGRLEFGERQRVCVRGHATHTYQKLCCRIISVEILHLKKKFKFSDLRA